jgi:hypothetical protein
MATACADIAVLSGMQSKSVYSHLRSRFWHYIKSAIAYAEA